ncbi:MAG: hypothetical protein NDI94_02880 [Candidatus Woesearchaeota archaeon]|nr:hypothetical protein [Candidatus Woesearchaeota archaeon]
MTKRNATNTDEVPSLGSRVLKISLNAGAVILGGVLLYSGFDQLHEAYQLYATGDFEAALRLRELLEINAPFSYLGMQAQADYLADIGSRIGAIAIDLQDKYLTNATNVDLILKTRFDQVLSTLENNILDLTKVAEACADNYVAGFCPTFYPVPQDAPIEAVGSYDSVLIEASHNQILAYADNLSRGYKSLAEPIIAAGIKLVSGIGFAAIGVRSMIKSLKPSYTQLESAV